MRVKLDN
jgi:hypothetical protein